jgi:N-acetyl sugar amidotransferase
MEKIETYKICSRCVMDTTDPDIIFDKNGVCNHCHTYDETKLKFDTNEIDRILKLQDIVAKIQFFGTVKGNCIIGMSGGIDSSYVAYTAVKMGLKPIAYHLDNEWDSDIAVKNIEKVTSALKIPFENVKVYWEEFKDLQLSFLKSSTPDVEVPTDHAIIAYPYIFAKKHNINYFLTGYNYRTESHLPKSWATVGQMDWDYIRAIHKKFGTTPLKNYPHITPLKYTMMVLNSPVKKIDLLNYMNYNRNVAQKLLENEFGYEYYGKKHWESIYTRFLQTYILPRKFNVDKRKSHLSSLICSGLMTREDALIELQKPPMEKEALLKDKQCILQKLGITDEYFESLMNLPPKSYWDYPHSKLFGSNIPRYIAKTVLRRKGI